jgi:dethiobiotin synthetase
MASRILFITGTDTGVGKTVLAVLVTRLLRERGLHLAALKPVCSGGREDARLLRDAAGRILTLDQVNPWHFRAPLTPALAARKEKRRVCLREVVAHIRRVAKSFDLVVVEGAGGLLSPLGEDFDSRDLIQALGATPIIVCPNRLGAVNQARLALSALPRAAARRARILLVNAARPDAAGRTNLDLLREFVDPDRLGTLPWLGARKP